MFNLIIGMLAFGFLLLAIHPFTTYPLSLYIISRLKNAPVPEGDLWDMGEHVDASRPPLSRWPSLSICFCNYNESSVIAAKMENLEMASAAYPGSTEILCYTDGCTDGTATLARKASATAFVLENPERMGKSVGMSALVSVASGEIIVFTDTDVSFSPDALLHMAHAFSDRAIGCAAGALIRSNPDSGNTSALGSLYWNFEEWIKRLETKTGSTMGASGAFFAIRKDLFRPVPADIIDDFYTSMSILCDGHRVVSIQRSIAYEKPAPRSADEFRRKMRISCRSLNCFYFLFPRLIRLSPLNMYKFASHKLLRWMTCFSLASAIFFFALLAYRFEVATPFIVAALGCLLMTFATRNIPKVGTPAEGLLAFVATGLGVLQSVRKRRYKTWQPPVSTR